MRYNPRGDPYYFTILFGDVHGTDPRWIRRRSERRQEEQADQVQQTKGLVSRHRERCVEVSARTLHRRHIAHDGTAPHVVPADSGPLLRTNLEKNARPECQGTGGAEISHQADPH